ncbi:MAG: DUF1761 domain-containing protein [Pseudomonadota bacterium]
MGWIGVIVAGLAGFGFGAIWYSVLAEPWRRAVGLSEAEAKAGMSRPTPFVIAVIGAVLVAGMMRHAFVTGGVNGFFECVVSGLGVGLFFAAPWLAISYGFAQRKPALMLIDGGHVTGACTVIGLTLSFFL